MVTDQVDAVDTGEKSNNAVFAALIEAQQEIGNITKNAKNDFFKDSKGKPSKFVDLAQLMATVLPALNKRGLTVIQRVDMVNPSGSDKLTAVLNTQVIYKDGTSLPESVYPIVAKDLTDPQKFGAGVTYARRYALMSYLGIAAEDDDGNLAAQPKPKPHTDLSKLLKANGISSKEEFTKAMKERFGDDTDKKSMASLSEDEANAWIKDLNKAGNVPF